jgi:CRP-like cAMP-binding protein
MATASLSAVRVSSESNSMAKSISAERAVLMCASALFADLSHEECLEIASCASVRTFARDELLFMQGQAARHMVMIETGSVKLSQLSSSGSEVILRLSGTGEAVSMHSECVSCNHTCSARAMEKCSALVWEYRKLQDLMVKYPQIRRNIGQIMSGRLDELQERFREVATEKVAARLALALQRLSKQVGKPSNGGVEIALSREELAQMTGTTLFTISRILSRWAEKGIVFPRREAVVVLDAQRLEQAGAEEV